MVASFAALSGDVPSDTPVGPRAAGDLRLAAELSPPWWLAVTVALPDAAARASTWRALRELDALNVHRGVWAVRADPDHRHRLEELVDRTVAAGGRASIAEVGDSSVDDVVLGSRLHRACERLWETLANQIDWYQARVARGSLTFAERVDEVTGLHEQFASVVGLDIARSQGSWHAETRLRQLGTELAAGDRVDPDAWCRSRPPVRRRVDLVTSFPLTAGDRAVVARVHPVPDPLWEAAFTGFEAFTYRPSSARPPLRAGVLRWTGPPGAEAAGVEAAGERVQRFEATLR